MARISVRLIVRILAATMSILKPKTRHHKKNADAILLAFTVELVFMIVGHLDASVIGCLCLCSHSWNNFLWNHPSLEDLRLPRDIGAPMLNSLVTAEILQPQRYRFLCLLEGDRVVQRRLKFPLNIPQLIGLPTQDRRKSFCSECFTLHPISAFRANIIDRSCCTRTCKSYGRDKLGLYDTIPDGFVDLCPCLKLYYPQKRKIFRELPDCEHPTREQRERLDNAPGWYECSDHLSPNISLEMKMKPLWRPCMGSWRTDILTEYRYTYDASSPLQTDRMLCPHKQLDATVHDKVTFKQRWPSRDPLYRSFSLRCPSIFHDFKIQSLSNSRVSVSMEQNRRLLRYHWADQVAFPRT